MSLNSGRRGYLRVVTLIAPAVVLAEEPSRSPEDPDLLHVEEIERRGAGHRRAVDRPTPGFAVIGEPERRTQATDVDRRVTRFVE